MNAIDTLAQKDGNNVLTVDTPQLMKMLDCGRKTAVEIGNSAEARVQIGRRVLWNVRRIERYLDRISE